MDIAIALELRVILHRRGGVVKERVERAAPPANGDIPTLMAASTDATVPSVDSFTLPDR